MGDCGVFEQLYGCFADGDLADAPADSLKGGPFGSRVAAAR